MTLRIGIDLGGSKIEIAAFDADGRQLLRRRVATPQGDYAATLETVAALVTAAESELGRQGTLGIGMPRAESRVTGLIKNANSTCLIGHPLRHDLETLLRREIRLANDANCFALSEAVDGAAAGAEVVFGVILGTGCGGGVVVRGQVLNGANAIAGEWGHNPLPWPRDEERPGPACYCGKQGCIETWLSGPGLAQDFHRHSGRELSAKAIAGLDDGDCLAAMARYEERLARGLAQVINLLDPEVIVLGGGLSKIARLYANVPRLWGRFVFSDAVTTRLLPPRHGDSGGVRGAAWLWNRQ
ncbi:MAG: ROK family protein [Pseudomonadota bacterium]|nr:ROK family protein [Pseudomonadota bacterium]MDP1904636.1 ROK family protein [Pseudomonadota bacterium]MDP2352966.1 ROK family protein [Pseudomonadota bacterium]